VKFLSLELKAYGQFTDLALDLDESEPTLHVIHGKNEAGKSTALRAIAALLYGFPHRSRDAYVHKKLVVGARLLLDDGAVASFTRVKGRPDKLFDEHGGPVGEAAIKSAVRGVSHAEFTSTFGLDHERLRDAGRSLLESGGMVADALFDASVGVPGVRLVLEKIEKEAEQLYTRRSTVKRIDVAIEDLTAIHREIRESVVEPEAFRQQRLEIDRVKKERDELDRRRRELRVRSGRLAREIAALPHLRECTRLARELERLGPAPNLASEDIERRKQASARFDEAGRGIASVTRDLARTSARLAEIRVDPIGEAADEVIDDLASRKAELLPDVRKLVRARAELGVCESEIDQILGKLGKGRESLDELQVSAALEATIKRMSEERAELAASHVHARSNLRKREAETERLRDRRAAVGPPRDVRVLERLEGEVEKASATERALPDLEHALATKENELAEAMRALDLWSGSAADARILAVPLVETVERFLREEEELVREAKLLAESLDAILSKQTEVERQLAVLSQRGPVPTELELSRLRTDRDRAWGVVRRALERSGKKPKRRDALGLDDPDAPRYEGLVREADAFADRLRREADRVAQHAELSTMEVARRQEREAKEARIAENAAALAEHRARWRRMWGAIAIEPKTPLEMRGWLHAFGAIRGLAVEIAAGRERLHAARQSVARTARALEEAIVRATGPTELPPSLEERWLLASALVHDERVSRERRRDSDDALERAKDELAMLETEERAAATALSEWQERWDRVVQPLGLDRHASPREAESVIALVGSLFSNRERALDHRREIGRVEEVERALDLDAARLAGRLAPDLAPLSTFERIDALAARHREATRAAEQRRHLEAQIDERRADLASLTDERDQAAQEIEVFLGRAAVSTLAELVEIETRVEAAHALAKQLRAAEERLADAADGADVAELRAALEGKERSVLAAEKDDLEREIETLDAALEDASRDLASKEAGLEHQRSRVSAADAATRGEQARARLVHEVDRFVRLRMASNLLRREIQRYREEHQGPLFRRANELFPALTQGRYREIRATFDDSDREVLRCVGQSGDEVAVDRLSEGTRDQLYLAFRIAALERHREDIGAIPFVLDDVLVNFDDERAEGALRVLREVSARTQVLLFTHLERDVALAERAGGRGRVLVHRLPEPKSREELRADQFDLFR
jgi:uncharacterized protein YhaN